MVDSGGMVGELVGGSIAVLWAMAEERDGRRGGARSTSTAAGGGARSTHPASTGKRKFEKYREAWKILRGAVGGER
jgi:hypothetical protein